MNFYFTATGNSLYVAKQLDDACISIPQAIHGDMHFADEKIGIVCPVFGHEMPEMVKQFLADAVFETDYFIWSLPMDEGMAAPQNLQKNIFTV